MDAFLHRIFAGLLRLVGKTYAMSPELPAGFLVHTLVRRLAWLLRALLRGRYKVFIGPGVKMSGGRRIKIGRFSTIGAHCQLDGYGREGLILGERVNIGDYTIIGITNHPSQLGKGLKIGSDSGVGQYSYFGALGGIEIGSNVIMGQYVSFHAASHVFDRTDIPIRMQASTDLGIRIDDDVWVGSKVTFLDGAHVGAHSVVAAGAVVRGTFPPYSVIGGVPAKLLKSRLNEASLNETPST
ncbi:acyltransferase [Rhizobium sp. PP-CC-3G-465]|uniref:acyltransferase n=1 Tax=Rhizobium sp. PP-CC-3G-465 TaxID=2135648 RepID=UPI001051E940|nr:acetyltransferase-like isoleucine patch superfamily enzyme [Rhizobium sp. PP-CC-3G-465]